MASPLEGIGRGDGELSIDDFLRGPHNVADGSTLLVGDFTPKPFQWPVLGEFPQAQIERAWAEGDDDTVRLIMDALDQA